MDKLIVTLTRRWPARVEAELQQEFSVRLNADDHVMQREELLEHCAGATVLCPTITDAIDRELIDRLPGTIRLIANFGAGTDRIDVAAAGMRGILVSNTPGAVVEDTADLAIGLIIAACRRFSEGEALLRGGGWAGFSLDRLLGTSVHGKTLGLVGMGKIGEAVARRAGGFGMRVLYHNRQRRPDAEQGLGAEYCHSLEDLLSRSDIVSLHCPLTPETRHLIDARAFGHMRPGSVLVNTARGAVINEHDLVQALRQGAIRAAALDVYEYEPRVSRELLDLENTVLIPHLGTATEEARYAMGRRVMENITSFRDSGRPRDLVAD